MARSFLRSEPRLRFFLFGSRASGTPDPRSDIDIGFDAGRELPLELLDRIRAAFDALPILQTVDVVDFATADPAFKAVALERTITLYERKAA